MLRLASLLVSLATALSDGFAANLPFAFIQSELLHIPPAGHQAVFAATQCCPPGEMMAICCSINSNPDLRKRVIVKPFAAAGKSSKLGYYIMFDVPTSLLGLPAASSFILNPVAKDKSLVRDMLAYNISDALGMRACKTRVLELFLGKHARPRYPHDYRGIYVLEEAVVAGETLPIGLKHNASQQANGFLLQVDSGGAQTGGEIKLSSSGIVLQSLYPVQLQSSSKLWLTLLLDKLEGAIFRLQQSALGVSGSKGVAKPADQWWMKQLHMHSCIDYFLLSELSNGIHSYGAKADVWFAEGQLHFGPPKDFTIAFGNAKERGGKATTGWRYKIDVLSDQEGKAGLGVWYEHLLRSQEFRESVCCRWYAMRGDTGLLNDENVAKFVDTFQGELLAGGGAMRELLQWRQKELGAADGGPADVYKSMVSKVRRNQTESYLCVCKIRCRVCNIPL
jgi:hypothetical protein